MLNQRAWRIGDEHRSPQALKQLQQDQNPELCDRTLGRAASQLELIRRGCKGDR